MPRGLCIVTSLICYFQLRLEHATDHCIFERGWGKEDRGATTKRFLLLCLFGSPPKVNLPKEELRDNQSRFVSGKNYLSFLLGWCYYIDSVEKIKIVLLCAVLCRCISVLGGTLISIWVWHAPHLLPHQSLVGYVVATSVIMPVLQGMFLPPLDLPGCTQLP